MSHDNVIGLPGPAEAAEGRFAVPQAVWDWAWRQAVFGREAAWNEGFAGSHRLGWWSQVVAAVAERSLEVEDAEEEFVGYRPAPANDDGPICL